MYVVIWWFVYTIAGAAMYVLTTILLYLPLYCCTCNDRPSYSEEKKIGEIEANTGYLHCYCDELGAYEQANVSRSIYLSALCTYMEYP